MAGLEDLSEEELMEMDPTSPEYIYGQKIYMPGKGGVRHRAVREENVKVQATFDLEK